MNLKFWQKATPAERAELRAEGVDVPDEVTFSTIEAAVEARIAEERATMQAELRKAHAERLQTEAAAFADKLIRTEHKALPAEREAIIAAYVTAAMDDAAHGKVTFASGKEGSRLEGLQALYAARPAHSLTRDQLDPSARFRVLPASGDGAEGQGEPDEAETPTPEGKPVAEARMSRLRSLANVPKTEKKA